MTQIQMNSNSAQPGQQLTYWQQKEDRDSPQFHDKTRSCTQKLGGGCPAVYVLLDDPHVRLTQQWQYFIRAINPQMSVHHVAALFGSKRAFCNRTGFGNHKNPRKDYLDVTNNVIEKDLPLPTFDKVRTCSRAVMMGYSSVDTPGSVFIKTFNGKLDPPLNDPQNPPESLDKVNISDYVYTPESNRELFFVANIVKESGHVVPFPNGGIYPWTGDNKPYVWMPLVSAVSSIDSDPSAPFYYVEYDKNELTPLGPNIPSPFPSPYNPA